MKYMRIIKTIIISLIIGLLSGEIFAWAPLLVLYVINNFALSLGDGEAMILIFCTQLHIRLVVSSAVSILVFLIGNFKILSKVTIGKIIELSLIIFLITIIINILSIIWAKIELNLTLDNLRNLFFAPWCWGW
jgi:hypothetical protein